MRRFSIAACVAIVMGACAQDAAKVPLLPLPTAATPIPAPVPTPPTPSSFTLSGFVNETTPAGPKPVEGALVQVSYADWLGPSTTTNRDGYYSLSLAPDGYWVEASKPGYESQGLWLNFTRDATMNLELRRR